MDIKAKKEKLKRLVREVDDFHPFLQELFSKLPDFSRVVYNHGQFEYGADFLLFQKNGGFGTEKILGVVAKVGKVDKAQVNNVSSQIAECLSIERFHPENNKKRIYLDGVVVVTNENITNNAATTIKSTHNGVNITLLDSNTLLDMVDKHMNFFWTDVNYEISKYLDVQHSTIDEINQASTLSAINITSTCFYIEPNISEMTSEDYSNKKKHKKFAKTLIDIRKKIMENDFIIIQSQMGGGKSKFLREIALEFTTTEKFMKCKYLPLLTTYREFLEVYELNIEKLVNSGYPDKLKSILAEDVKYLLLIDGYDEVMSGDDDKNEDLLIIKDDLEKLNNVKIIITSRILVSSLNEQKATLPDIKVYDINPLSNNQLVKFVSKLCKDINIQNRIFDDLKKSIFMKDISRSPIVAIILAELINENNTEDLPSNITELYSKYLEIVLGRWDVDRGLLALKEYEVANTIIEEISYNMMISNRDDISVEEFTQFFSEYINKRKFDFTATGLVNKIFRRSGLFYLHPNTNFVSFKHRTFMEFFYAKYANKNKSLEINNDMFKMYWINSYFFYFGLKKDCSSLLMKTVSLQIEDPGNRLVRIINMSNLLMASYTTPVADLERILTETFIEMAKTYSFFNTDKTEKNPLINLPKVHLIGLMSLIMKENYNFHYFEDMISNTALEIIDVDCSEEDKMIAHFILALVAVELGDMECLDLFIDLYSNNLPLEFKFMLFFEEEHMSNKSEKLKSILKSIRRKLKNTDNELLKQLIGSTSNSRSLSN